MDIDIPLLQVSGSYRAEAANNEPGTARESETDNDGLEGYCMPEEHLYVQDSAAICVKCGKCSVRRTK